MYSLKNNNIEYLFKEKNTIVTFEIPSVPIPACRFLFPLKMTNILNCVCIILSVWLCNIVAIIHTGKFKFNFK